MKRTLDTQLGSMKKLQKTGESYLERALEGSTGASAKIEKNLPKLNYNSGIAITNCNVIDVRQGRVLEDRTVLIKKNKIIEIKKGSVDYYADFGIIDADGRYLMPGLIDAHCHTTLTSAGKFNPLGLSDNIKQLGRNFHQHIANGTTTVRDMSSFTTFLQKYRNKIEKGVIIGPRIVYCGSFINVEGSHPDISPGDISVFGKLGEKIMGEQAARYKTTDELVQRLVEARDNGAFFLKLSMDNYSLMSGKGEIPVYTDEQLKIIMKFSRKYDLPVAAHQHLLYGFKRAVKYGVHSLEHTIGDGTYSDRDIKSMVRKEISVVPTMVVGQMHAHEELFRELPAEYQNEFIYNELQERKKFIFEKQDKYCVKSIYNDNRDMLKYFKKYRQDDLFKKGVFLTRPQLYFGILKYGPGNIKKLKDAGIIIGAGTDAGIPYVYHGTLWRELEILHRSGLTKKEVLKAATINNAKILRMDKKVGSIEKGKLADMIILDRNPLKEITAYRQPLLVMVNGRIKHFRRENHIMAGNTLKL